MFIHRSVLRGSLTALLTLVLTAIFLTVPERQAWAAEQVKIGYIDLQRVANAVAKQTPEHGEMTKELEKRQAEAERRRADIEKLEQDLEANRVIWSQDKVREQEKLIQDQVDDLRAYSEGARRFYDVEQNKIWRRIKPEIGKTLNEVGQREGYSMIFERSILLYLSPNFDLSDVIIKEMSENKEQE